MAREDVIASLRRFPALTGLPDEELQGLASLLTYRTFPRGTFIVRQSAPGTALYLLVDGRVKVSVCSAEGKELALDYLDAPSHFGEMSLVDAGPRSADVVAMTDVGVLVLDAKDLGAAVQAQPRLAVMLISTLSARVRNLIDRLEQMAFSDSTRRVMRVLLNIATAAYEDTGVPVIEGVTHYEIATLAGTSRETASRVISQLQRDGIAATKGRRIVVDLIRLHEALD